MQAGWSATVLPGGEALVSGVAAGPTSVVAVGKGTCVWNSEREPGRCWGAAWTSPDGSTWEAVDGATAGLALGISRPVLSGPEVGLDGVAYGPAGFLAYGRVQTGKDGQVPAVWRSDDGTTWERLTGPDSFAKGARMRTILGAADGYLLGGVIYAKRSPRAAIWSSPDGRTWTLAGGAKGGTRAFDIGGYIDTLEDPLSGGVNAFAFLPAPADGTTGSLADGVVAVGQACAPAIDKKPWAWNGTCWGQQWTTSDGSAWEVGDMARSRGAASGVATVGDRLVVAAPACWDDCSSVLLRADGGAPWDIAYGGPVGGEVKTLTAAGGHDYALVAVPETLPQGPASLAFWSSGDGTNWAMEQAQPPMPLGPMWLQNVDATVLGDRLLVTASATEGVDVPGGSIALLSPPLP